MLDVYTFDFMIYLAIDAAKGKDWKKLPKMLEIP
jgi:hypothetical protein